jgi:hypothetical protein
MAWFKVDDGFYSSRKVLSIPRDRRLGCMGIWVIAGAWASKEMTDGRVPLSVLYEFGASTKEIEDLVNSGLWKQGDGIVEFHDWFEYQPTKIEVLEKRKKVSSKRSEAGKIGAATRWQNDGKRIAKKVLPLANDNFAIDAADSEVNESLAQDGKMAKPWQADGKRIAPTRPDPTRKQSKDCLLPQSWNPNTACQDFARANNLDVEFEAGQFRAHADATQRKMKNWDAAFRVWLGNAVKWKKPANNKATTENDWMNE